ncbi:MAG: sulfotransferase family 2 domain-containing protein [Actinomycetota bacterium]|nr:sulfotransferase family 2 domain-containing protein [Actinomycetota bacterium]
MSHSPLLFIHIAKTGGSSLKALLGTRIAPSATLELPERIEHGSPLLDQLDDFELVVGHVSYDITRAFRRPPSVITFLREPIDRALSAYYFLRQTDDSNIPLDFSPAQRSRRQALGEHVRELPLREFLRSHRDLAAGHMGNVQTAILGAQSVSGGTRGTVGRADLSRAKENLTKCVAFGVTERVDASMTLICEALGWPSFTGFPHVNPTLDRTAVSQLDPATLDDLREFTELDAELYRFATELFEQRWQQWSADHPAAGAAGVEPPTDAETSFRFDRRIPGTGWHGSERFGDSWISWTGPGTVSTIDLDLPSSDHVMLRVTVTHTLDPEALHLTQLLVNDIAVAVAVRAEATVHHLEAAVPLAVLQRRDDVARITIRTPFVLRPCDVDPNNADSRRLGIAATNVALLPAP